MRTATVMAEPHHSSSPASEKPAGIRCLAILWIKKAANLDACMQLVARQPGVGSVRIGRNAPCFMIVEYNRREIAAQHIQQFIDRLGIHARLIGC